MTPRPYRQRAYSHVPNHEKASMTGTYTIHGGRSSWNAQATSTMPKAPETTCTSGIMTGAYHSAGFAPTRLKAPRSVIGQHRNGPLWAPTPPYAASDGRSVDHRDPAPLNQASLASSHRNIAVAGPVLLLLSRRCPAAIARLVVPIIVDTVEAGARRALPHVGKEVLEAIPALTDADTPASVAGVLRVVGVKTPLPHRAPDNVCAPPRSPGLRLAVLRVSGRRGRALQTAARARVPVHQMRRRHGCALAASTLAYPGASFGFLVDVDRRQVSECSSRQIVNFRHAREYAVFPHWRQ